jgi:hypothetical protein
MVGQLGTQSPKPLTWPEDSEKKKVLSNVGNALCDTNCNTN